MGDITTKEYIEKILDAKLETITMRMDAQDKALALANEELQRRFRQINELHGEVLEDRTRFVTREVYDKDQEKCRQSNWTCWAAIIGWILAIVSMVVAYFKKA